MEKLVKKAMKGNKVAFEKLILENLDEMYKIAYAILKNEDEREDAVSNTVLKVFEKISTLRHPEYFKTWMIRILINECNQMIRKNKKVVEFSKEAENQIGVGDFSFGAEFDIRQVVEGLEKDLRETVILYYFDDLEVKKIAQILEIPEGTVKSRLARARKVLAEKLGEEREDV